MPGSLDPRKAVSPVRGGGDRRQKGMFIMSAADGANLLLGLVALVGVVSTLGGMACVYWVTRRRQVVDHTPPVTIFKPLKGLDEELELNLRSFFQLDYPSFQLLFCVAET